MLIKITTITILLNHVYSMTNIQIEQGLRAATDQTNAFIAKLNKTIQHYDQEMNTMAIEVMAEIKVTQQLAKNPVPLGFIYVQLPHQTDPAHLWPMVKWTDITSEYAGLFFRVIGGDSGAFNVIQQANYSRIEWIKTKTMVGLVHNRTHEAKDHVLNEESWGASNQWVQGAYLANFYHSHSENVPQNTAIKVWKRSA
ncbi:unnamed protein product [Oppiella nova]|uniref:Uncharacterized protein n=1 Tax=Oppiella nova TaxID=334625 RepID=A0A7R9LW17_9ACAR|nr:unnamed protein product [Oppiella nova]CAG2167411.1 unnamed protein product [Oppiella nova]